MVRQDLFEEEDWMLSRFAHGLSHPARLMILRMLGEAEEGLCCREMVHALPLAQATVSQHLKILVEAGLVKGCEEGNRVVYQLIRESLDHHCRCFKKLFFPEERNKNEEPILKVMEPTNT